jgi:hypothetical protein
VLFEVPAAEIGARDKRESLYCRVAVPAGNLVLADGPAP